MAIEVDRRSSIINAVTRPLGFFALSLLIVEGFLGITLIYSGLEPERKFLGMIAGAVLFALVVSIVGLIVWNKPKHLVFGETGILREREMEIYGSNLAPLKKEEVEKEKSVPLRKPR